MDQIIVILRKFNNAGKFRKRFDITCYSFRFTLNIYCTFKVLIQCSVSETDYLLKYLSVYLNFGFQHKRRRYFLTIFSVIFIYVEAMNVLTMVKVFNSGRLLELYIVTYFIIQQLVSTEIKLQHFNIFVLTRFH